MIQRERVDDFLLPASYSQHTYPYSLLWLNIHAYRNKQDAETRSCFSSRNNRSSPICHLFTPGWMWVEMLEVKSGACQCLHRAASRPGLCAITPGRRAGVRRCGSSLGPSQYRLASTRRQPASSLPRSGHWAPNLGPK